MTRAEKWVSTESKLIEFEMVDSNTPSSQEDMSEEQKRELAKKVSEERRAMLLARIVPKRVTNKDAKE